MDIKDIAQRILQTSQLYSSSAFLVALNKGHDENVQQENRDKMEKARQDMVDILTEFQNSILEQAKR